MAKLSKEEQEARLKQWQLEIRTELSRPSGDLPKVAKLATQLAASTT